MLCYAAFMLCFVALFLLFACPAILYTLFLCVLHGDCWCAKVLLTLVFTPFEQVLFHVQYGGLSSC
jgi:hypothetical protein